MNDKRRKIIHAQRQRLEALKAKIEELKAEAESISGELEAVRDEEQEAFDNMSLSQQSGERGNTTEAAIDSLDTAISALDEIEDLIDTSTSTHIRSLVPESASNMLFSVAYIPIFPCRFSYFVHML